jgi:hypothetical protein
MKHLTKGKMQIDEGAIIFKYMCAVWEDEDLWYFSQSVVNKPENFPDTLDHLVQAVGEIKQRVAKTRGEKHTSSSSSSNLSALSMHAEKEKKEKDHKKTYSQVAGKPKQQQQHQQPPRLCKYYAANGECHVEGCRYRHYRGPQAQAQAQTQVQVQVQQKQKGRTFAPKHTPAAAQTHTPYAQKHAPQHTLPHAPPHALPYAPQKQHMQQQQGETQLEQQIKQILQRMLHPSSSSSFNSFSSHPPSSGKRPKCRTCGKVHFGACRFTGECNLCRGPHVARMCPQRPKGYAGEASSEEESEKEGERQVGEGEQQFFDGDGDLIYIPEEETN